MLLLEDANCALSVFHANTILYLSIYLFMQSFESKVTIDIKATVVALKATVIMVLRLFKCFYCYACIFVLCFPKEKRLRVKRQN